jgi:enoyl-CoA hydratase/carnithine racemase
MSELLVEKQGGVTILTLNRPDRMNAISGPMLSAFSEQLLEANRDPEVRVVVITGAGRAFCAGLDLKEQASGGNLGGGFDLREAPPVVLHQMDKPTIAAINGGAAGYGMDLAIGCDIRLASDAAKLSAAFTKRGVIPESGGTWLMPRLLGWAKASEIFFTGRTLSAEECLQLGLVTKVVPGELLMKETLALAHEIAANAPLAVQGTKRMMRMGLTETFEANVHHVYLQLLPLFRSKDFTEGVKSFLEKRPPKFEGK